MLDSDLYEKEEEMSRLDLRIGFADAMSKLSWGHVGDLTVDTAPEMFEKAFARILRADSIRDFADVGTARTEALYSLEPRDYQTARRLVLDAIAKK